MVSIYSHSLELDANSCAHFITDYCTDFEGKSDPNTRENFFTWRVTEHWDKLEQRGCGVSSGDSKPSRTQSCTTCSRWTCFRMRGGLGVLQRSLPTPAILGLGFWKNCSSFSDIAEILSTVYRIHSRIHQNFGHPQDEPTISVQM